MLLHQHKRLGLWLQPGGHIDDGELAVGRCAARGRGGDRPAGAVVRDGDDAASWSMWTCIPGRASTPISTCATSSSRRTSQPPSPPPGESQEVQWFQWHQAIAITEPGLEGALRALQPGTPTICAVRGQRRRRVRPRLPAVARFGLPEVPWAHAPADVKRWMADEVVGRTDMWVADVDGVIAGYLVLSHDRDGAWIDHLYLDPSWIGRGLGERFIEVAKRRGSEGLQLWAFQSQRARPSLLRAARVRRRRAHRRWRQRRAHARRALPLAPLIRGEVTPLGVASD